MKIKQEQIEQYDLGNNDYINKVKSKYAQKIGQYLIQFSSLEYTLDLSIVEYVSDRAHELGYMILVGNNLNNKIELFRRLYLVRIKYLQPKRFKKLDAIIKQLNYVRIFRNYISHANWETLERTGYVRTRVTENNGDVIFKKVRITPKVINAWIRRVNRLKKHIIDFADEVNSF